MDVVSEVKARLDIVEVVSAYVPLKKAGRNYKGLCPFHSEKTPSFFVFPETQTWHCFGACGTGGDVFTFIMKAENLDFGEALRLLAARAGVTLKPPRPRDAEREKYLQRLYDILAAAAEYFAQALNSARGAPGREYIAARGLNEETVRKFQLGFALDEWRGLSKRLLARGYERQDLEDAGLIVVREDGRFYDRFRGRVMIPIRDIRGRVIGFGGRVVGDGEPKYLNTPQTPLFNKSHVLFGLDVAKGAIRARGYAVIVEGYMDVLQAHQAGIGNVVASMGTALTEHQLGLLKRMTKRYVLALDPDLAGDKGTLRGLAIARQTLDRQTVPVPTARGWIRYESRLDADIRIMTLPPGKDPDDLIRESPERWAELVEAAIPLVDYYFQVSARDLDLSAAKGKSEFVRRLAPVIQEIRDEVERTHYIQKLARMIRVDERAVRTQLRFELRRKRSSPVQMTAEPSADGREEPPFALEEYCLTAFIRDPNLYARMNVMLSELALGTLDGDDFERAENRAIFEAWSDENAPREWEEWVATLPPTLQLRLDFLLERGKVLDELPPEDLERDLERAVLLLRRRRLERMSRHLSMLQVEALEQGDAKAVEYSRAVVELTGERLQVERALAARTAVGRREEKELVL